jgi:ubiquitin fusion degradation protein 1
MAFYGFSQGFHPLGMPFPVPRKFMEQFRCYSMVFSTKDSMEVKHGGKIIMPPSALEKLARLNITYPMLFKLTNDKEGLFTHCGVLEFVAEEGRIYVPHWMMNQLNISEGDIVIVDNATLPLATFSKFQPQSKEFLDISNPKAVYPPPLFCTRYTVTFTAYVAYLCVHVCM